MQTDAWLTETSYPDRCPLCNRPLANGSNTCLSCGFTAHESADASASQTRPQSSRRSNPITPIPARASARRAQSSPGGPARRVVASQSAGGQMPARQWRHESPSYEAASSLSALSLIISETPTAPPRPQRQTERLAHIDEIDTVPQPVDRTRAIQHSSDQESGVAQAPVAPDAASTLFADIDVPNLVPALAEISDPVPVSHIDEIDTVPDANKTFYSASSQHSCPVPVSAASWTAGSHSSRSLAAQPAASRFQLRHRQSFSPLDHTRWWLLRPGHIEFFLWLVGSLLLFGITFIILLATVLSMMLPGQPASGNLPTSTVKTSTITPGSTTAIASTPGTQSTSSTPSTSPTQGTTATSARPVGTSSSSQRQTGNSPGLGNALNSDDNNSFLARLAHLNPLVWVIGACYIASMLLLGLAGVLHRRR